MYRILTILCVTLLAFSAFAAEQITIVYTDAGDGEFAVSEAYLVSPTVAQRAYAESGSRAGDNYVYGIGASGKATLAGTGESFEDFLAANYTPIDVGSDRFPGDACDRIIGMKYTWDCSPYTCPEPPGNCSENADLIYKIQCYLDQDCDGHPNEACVWNKAANITTVTTDKNACGCIPEPNTCSPQGATITSFTADANLCHCATREWIPSLSEWGLLILVALLLGSTIWVMRRKRANVPA